MDYKLIGVAVAVMLFTGTAMVLDLKSKTLPNWLNVGALILALIYQGATSGVPGLKAACGGFAVGFGILFVLWLMGGAGGGDVKMMGALGAWLGGPLTVVIFLGSAVVALLGLVVTGIAGLFRGPASNEPAPSDSAANVGEAAAGKTDAGQPEDGHSSEVGHSSEDGQPGDSPSPDKGPLRQPIPYAVPVAIATWGIMILKVVSSVIVHS